MIAFQIFDIYYSKDKLLQKLGKSKKNNIFQQVLSSIPITININSYQLLLHLLESI